MILEDRDYKYLKADGVIEVDRVLGFEVDEFNNYWESF